MNELIGKIPPQDIEIEEIVLGAILLEKGQAIYISKLNIELFYSTQNQIICEGILSLAKQGLAIDILTLKDELTKQESLDQIGGVTTLTKITSKIASTAHTEYHIKILSQLSKKRQLIQMGGDMVQSAYNQTSNPLELISMYGNQLINLSISKTEKEPQFISEVLDEVLSSKKGNGIKSKFNELNYKFGGYEEGKLYIVAARPGMGKTSFMLEEAIHFSKMGLKVAVASLEMINKEIGVRISTMLTGINPQKIKSGDLSQREYDQISSSEISNKSLLCYDKAALTMIELRSFCQKALHFGGLDVLLVDYLQLMKDPDQKNNREREISELVSGLKNLAKELNIPVIGLSQLSREVERRPNKKPMLSDLRESGAIEQDADVVMLIWRPCYYDSMKGGEYAEDEVMIIIAKARHAYTGEIMLQWIGETTSFNSRL